MNITLEALYHKFQFLKKRKNTLELDINYEDLDNVIKPSVLDSSVRILNINKEKIESKISIYTDGSKIGGKVGCALVVFREDELIEVKRFKLRDNNSVYQAELSAIMEAVRWGEIHSLSINIYSDSKSAIDTLTSINCRTELVRKAKEQISKRTKFFNLQWVKAHDFNVGNEKADIEAKRATIDGEILKIGYPLSYFKGLLSTFERSRWSSDWSMSCNRTHLYIPNIKKNFYSLNKHVTQFITGHGPFSNYLHRFKIKKSDLCPCGQIGSPDHFAFDCCLTSRFHLETPTQGLESHWLEKLLEDNEKIIRLKQCLELTNKIVNDLPLDG